MSMVTNVLLAIGIGNSNRGIANINQELDNRYKQELRSIDEGPGGNQVGGSKRLEVEVWAAALGGVPTETLLRLFGDAPWEDPDNVQLMVCEQEEDRFTVYPVVTRS